MNDRKSIVCPNCGKLISDYLAECPYCNLKQPARKGLLSKLFMPIGDDIKRIIIGISIIMFALEYFIPLFLPIPNAGGRDLLGLIPSPGSVTLNLLGWADIRLLFEGRWSVLITAIFLHGGILHILFNMLWVRDLTPNTKAIFGPWGVVIIFIISGVLGNLVALFTPLVLNMLLHTQYPYAPVIGASGAVFGLMGSMVAFGRKKGGFFGRQLARQIGMWALIMIVMGFLFPGISNAAHIGGFIGGFIVGKIIPATGPGHHRNWVFIAASITLIITALAFIQMAIRFFSIVSGI